VKTKICCNYHSHETIVVVVVVVAAAAPTNRVEVKGGPFFRQGDAGATDEGSKMEEGSTF
jgi:hypothetical protein